ncbi:hypothetical protein [Bradyrhizobium sp. SRS-191]|uniref:hypothetical protein n=1 Tax=Bradyrhizobium sp. SRS-191 TaxID=2962606 RepID=UPI00211F2B32|nr:hypothetical protein [Bradyrhizobium sp. SRS-191]
MSEASLRPMPAEVFSSSEFDRHACQSTIGRSTVGKCTSRVLVAVRSAGRRMAFKNGLPYLPGIVFRLHRVQMMNEITRARKRS